MSTKRSPRKDVKHGRISAISHEKSERKKQLKEAIQRSYKVQNTEVTGEYPRTEDTLNVLEQDEIISLEDIEQEKNIYDDYTGELIDTEYHQESVLRS